MRQDAMDNDEQHSDAAGAHSSSQVPSTNSSPWSFHELPSPDDRARASQSRIIPRTPTKLSRRAYSAIDGAPGSSSIFGAAGEPSTDESDGLAAEQPRLSALQAGPALEQQFNRTSVDPRMLPQAEKDADDPTEPPASSRDMARQDGTTLTALSRLFAVQAETSPDVSRQPSFIAQTCRQPFSYSRALQSAETAALPEHLYARGLLSGKHSDICVNAFGQQYRLHRLILDRSPFFSSALSEPWLEANAKEMNLHPEDVDSSINQASFELALKRLYGCCNLADEDRDPVGLFATGCWLEMQDLIDSSIESMLRQMTPETLSPLIKLVTNNYYGRAGDKILASSKAMLCRDGWKMPLRFWNGIPGDIIREIVGGDGFYIDGEWDRWLLAKRILDERLKIQAAMVGLLEPGSRRKPMKVPNASNLMALRFDSTYRRNHIGNGGGIPENLHKWIALYTHPNVEPILVLLDEGIHYLHLDFEQLQCIRGARDCLGLPVMSEKVISNALWQQMELRQRVMNAREVQMELGLSVQSTEDAALGSGRDATMSIVTPSEPQSAKGKGKAQEFENNGADLDSGSWDGNARPRKFWIPSSDCNIVMGGNADPIIATSNNTTMQRHASRLSATIQPEDIQWVADFSAATSQPRRLPPSTEGAGQGFDEPLAVSYSHYPPFRFAAEFPNPRSLKEKRRVYSRTVFYAGSLWNIYIQKVASSRNKQLGVYLHRAKERETEEVIAGTAGLAQGSVDERIGQLEREMIMRSERRERQMRRRTGHVVDGADADGESSAGDHDNVVVDGSNETGSRASMMKEFLSRGQNGAGRTETLGSPPPSSSNMLFSADELTPESDFDSDDSETEHLTAATEKFHIPTLPPYVDARPTIKTYFKIYSPSRGGRMLSVYESAPDKFNFSQSWGWKSSTLMLDEGILEDEMDDMGKEDGMEAALGEKDGVRRTMKEKGDGKLRFMVVIGNI